MVRPNAAATAAACCEAHGRLGASGERIERYEGELGPVYQLARVALQRRGGPLENGAHHRAARRLVVVPRLLHIRAAQESTLDRHDGNAQRSTRRRRTRRLEKRAACTARALLLLRE